MVHSRRGPGLGAGLQKLSCVALVVSVVLLGCGVSGALATAGGLDLTFSGDGKQITGFGGTDRANAVAIQSNGKIVVVGSSDALGTSDFALARYNADGSLDAMFGVNGLQTTNFGRLEAANAVAIQSNGKIVVVGSSDALGTSDFALARYNADGSLDATFGVNGLQITNFGNLEVANAVAIQSDGKIVVAGWTNVFGTFDFALARYNADGSLDATFDGDGKKITSFGGDDRANAVAIQKSDGRIVVAGWTNVFGTFDFALARYNANGSLDVTFDGDGKKISGFGGDDRANAVAIQKSDGRIVVAGWTNVFGTADFALARYNVDGSLDATFDVNGEKITGFGGDERANAVVVQSNGKIVAAGWTDVLGTFDFALARYNADGSLDATFDGDGKKITSFGSDDRARAMAIQSNGRIVVAGWTNVFGTFDFALARFLVE